MWKLSLHKPRGLYLNSRAHCCRYHSCPAQRQMHKAFVMLRFAPFVPVRNDKIWPKGRGSRWGCFAQWAHQQPLLGAVSAGLQGWMGSVAGFPWQTNGVDPAIPAGSFSFTETQDDPNLKHDTQPQYHRPHDEPACSSRSTLDTSTQKWL